MNATFGEVLREVPTSLLNTKLDMKRSRIRRWCSKTKRVLRRSGFALGCHTQTLCVCVCVCVCVCEREREREREKQKNTIIESTKIKKWKCTYAWNVHEHVTCKENCIMDSSQSNPNNTQVSTYKHTFIIHETLWKCKCNAMHEHITSYKQNPNQKFHKILNNFQKP